MRNRTQTRTPNHNRKPETTAQRRARLASDLMRQAITFRLITSYLDEPDFVWDLCRLSDDLRASPDLPGPMTQEEADETAAWALSLKLREVAGLSTFFLKHPEPYSPDMRSAKSREIFKQTILDRLEGDGSVPVKVLVRDCGGTEIQVFEILRELRDSGEVDFDPAFGGWAADAREREAAV